MSTLTLSLSLKGRGKKPHPIPHSFWACELGIHEHPASNIPTSITTSARTSAPKIQAEATLWCALRNRNLNF